MQSGPLVFRIDWTALFRAVQLRRDEQSSLRKVIHMSALKIVAAVLIVAGALGLVYGGFSYNKESQGAKLGPLELTITEKETVNIPVWAGVVSVLAGVGIFAYPLLKQ